jgi:hypothetical protein
MAGEGEHLSVKAELTSGEAEPMKPGDEHIKKKKIHNGITFFLFPIN